VNWTIDPETGKKTVYVKLKDNVGNVGKPAVANITYEIPKKGNFPYMIVLIILIAIPVALIIGFVVLRHKSGKARKERSNPKSLKRKENR
jgi:subtilase family serine protease